MSESFFDNVVPIGKGIEIREAKVFREQEIIENELRSVREEVAQLNKQISEELQIERDDKTDSILEMLTRKHTFLKEEEKKLLAKYDTYEKKGDRIAEQGMRLKQQHEKHE